MAKVFPVEQLVEEAVKTADHIAGLSQVPENNHPIRRSQQNCWLPQIAVAIAKESTNAAAELTLKEGLRFEKRMFQVKPANSCSLKILTFLFAYNLSWIVPSTEVAENNKILELPFFAGIFWNKGPKRRDDCLRGEEEGKLGTQIVFFKVERNFQMQLHQIRIQSDKMTFWHLPNSVIWGLLLRNSGNKFQQENISRQKLDFTSATPRMVEEEGHHHVHFSEEVTTFGTFSPT